MFSLTILGSNSAIPAYGRHPTAQLLQTQEESFLIDCGEGTQMRISAFKLKPGKISRIFISHLHGDHYFGLIGLLTSFSLNGRKQVLHVHAHAPLEKIIALQLEAAEVKLSYPLEFHVLSQGTLYESDKIMISGFEVRHRIECMGFLFREKKKPRKLIPEKAIQHGIPPHFFEQLLAGEDYLTDSNHKIENIWVTEPALPGKAYAYCADTLYFPELAQTVFEVDLLYHETTYLKDMEQKAGERYHSTSTQAALLAQQAKVKKLMIGHFSSKYEQLDAFLHEAREIFPDTELALEGSCYRI